MKRMSQKTCSVDCRGKALHLDKPRIMGILNVTPDSFSDGGTFFDAEKAIAHAKQMVAEGADIIDIGGESTRPFSEPVSIEEEVRRVKPVIEALIGKISVPLSIDSYKPEVVEECLKLGVHMVNDVTGLRNPAMIKVVAKYKVPVVIMHMLGNPKNMQENPTYTDVVQDIKAFLQDRIAAAEKAGIKDMLIDPGIGFGKKVWHNLEIIKRLEEFKELGKPILIGPSRKSFIGKISNVEVPERLPGTLAAITACILHGANMVRVHDVKECKKAIEIVEAIQEPRRYKEL